MELRCPQAVFLSLLLLAGSCKSTPERTPLSGKEPLPQEEPRDAERFRIDVPASRFTATVGTAGALSFLGHDHTIEIRGFSGEVRLTRGRIEPAWLRMAIQAASLGEAGTAFNEKDRQEIDQDVHERALEASKYPEVLFESTRVSIEKAKEGLFQVQIDGTLTLHGVARTLTIYAQVTLLGSTLRARGSFTIRHSDFGIERLSAAAGTVRAKDEIVLTFDLVARKGAAP